MLAGHSLLGRLRQQLVYAVVLLGSAGFCVRAQEPDFFAHVAAPELPARQLTATELLDQALAAAATQPHEARQIQIASTLQRLTANQRSDEQRRDERLSDKAATFENPRESAAGLLFVTQIRSAIARDETAALALAQERFEQLHNKVLTGDFEPGCGRLERTLSDGHYNCLTATLLYLAACRESGLDARALSAPGHVCALLKLAEASYVIELTQPDWNATLYQPPHRDLRAVSDGCLLARVYYNLGIEYAAEQQPEAAMMAAKIACELDTDDMRAKDNLLAILHNRCLELLQAGEPSQAWRLVMAGLHADPQHAGLRRCENYLKEFDSCRHPE